MKNAKTIPALLDNEAALSALGAELARVLKMRHSDHRDADGDPDRWETSHGDKTAIGLARTVAGLLDTAAARLKVRSVSMEEIRLQYSPGEGAHFFDPSTMRAFRSRLPRAGYNGPGGTYFVTSEQFENGRGNCAPRVFTVRHLVGPGMIRDAGKAHAHASDATAAAKRFAKEGATE